jgi:hypothetical protein
MVSTSVFLGFLTFLPSKIYRANSGDSFKAPVNVDLVGDILVGDLDALTEGFAFLEDLG